MRKRERSSLTRRRVCNISAVRDRNLDCQYVANPRQLMTLVARDVIKPRYVRSQTSGGRRQRRTHRSNRTDDHSRTRISVANQSRSRSVLNAQRNRLKTSNSRIRFYRVAVARSRDVRKGVGDNATRNITRRTRITET